MHIMPAKTALAALALLGSVQAHTRFTTLFVDGQNQGDGVCVRMDMNGNTCNSPIAGLQSPEMACGRDGEKGVARVCPAKAGSTLTFEFREWVDGSQPGAIDPQHQGPCAVYMKKVDSAIADNNAAGDGWFKIWDEGFDEAAGKWCINKMIDNNGHLSVSVPSDIEAGYYLVRPELLALHAAQDSPPDPQFYVGCAQIYLESTGSARPATITIPENYVDISMPGMTFNVYAKPLALPYPMFGPSAYNGGGSSAPSATASATATATKSPISSSSAIASPSTSDYVEASESTTPDAPATSDAVGTNSTATDDAATDSSDAYDTPANFVEVGNTQAEDTEDNTQSQDTKDDDAEADDTDVDDSKDDGAEEDGAKADDTSDDECDAEESEDDSEGDDDKTSPSYSRRDVQIEGLKPEGCIMVNANWCGFEVKSYTDENGCWSASADCWTQSKACFDQAPPTGAKNCELWNDKCNNLDNTCNAKQFTGPPNAGKDLTPTPPDLASTASSKLMALVKKHESHVMRRAYRARH